MKISLPPEIEYEGISVGEAIRARRSLRDYTGEALSLKELSLLLYYADGVTDKIIGFRAAPSAGATFPIDIYPVANNVEGLKPGIYRYLPEEHALELKKEGDFRRELVSYGLGQEMLGTAGAVLVLVAVFPRIRRIYGERGWRYVFLEAGHIAQNIYLVATSLNLGTCAIGAFYDDHYNRLFEVNGREESVIYLLPVGRVRR